VPIASAATPRSKRRGLSGLLSGWRA
jgi:hypothetical protein